MELSIAELKELLNCGQRASVLSLSASYAMDENDPDAVIFNVPAAPDAVLTLPDARKVGGRKYWVQIASESVAEASVVAASSQSISGNHEITVGKTVVLVSDGANWHSILRSAVL